MSGAAPLSSGRADAVVELRQYTLHPGRRDELVALFEDVFLDGQAAAGIDVIGHFRDADDPDRFVWLRRFDSMKARADALARFYDGPLWRAHRDAANATMRDSDNVLLLRPCGSAPAMIDHRDGAGTHVVIVHDVARVDATRFGNTRSRSACRRWSRPAPRLRRSSSRKQRRTRFRGFRSAKASRWS